MAAVDGVIDAYVSVLRRRLRDRDDRDELVDEISDHLLTAAERLVALGIARGEAESRALARLGDPRLVATLLTSTPSKGTVLSLFLARRLGVFAALASLAWAAAGSAAFFGLTALSGSWDPQAYLLSAGLVGLACLLSTLVLLGVSIRAKGRIDAAAVWIAVLAVVATLAGTLLTWIVALWMPLLAAAVTRTCLRARHAHAGSPVFTVVLAALAPVTGLVAIAVTAYGFATQNGMEAAIWGSVAALAALLLAGFADIAARVVHTLRTTPALAS